MGQRMSREKERAYEQLRQEILRCRLCEERFVLF